MWAHIRNKKLADDTVYFDHNLWWQQNNCCSLHFNCETSIKSTPYRYIAIVSFVRVCVCEYMVWFRFDCCFRVLFAYSSIFCCLSFFLIPSFCILFFIQFTAWLCCWLCECVYVLSFLFLLTVVIKSKSKKCKLKNY